LYGAPGSFRPKSFGVEYRPLSNAWLNSPEIAQQVYAITLGVIRGIDSGEFLQDVNDEVTPLNSVQGRTNTQVALSRLSKYIPEMFK
jgi:hypothetical protein